VTGGAEGAVVCQIALPATLTHRDDMVGLPEPPVCRIRKQALQSEKKKKKDISISYNRYHTNIQKNG
jgi:hypothetical protein